MGEYYNNIVKDSLSVTTEMPNFKSALHSDASNCFTSLICSLKCIWWFLNFTCGCEIFLFYGLSEKFTEQFLSCPGKKWVLGGVKACTPRTNQWKDQGYNSCWQIVLWGWCIPNSSLRWETLQISCWKGHQEENLRAWKDLECYPRSTKGKGLIVALAFCLILPRVLE